MVYAKKTKVKSNKHICSECIEDFDAKDLFVARVIDREYTTLYCDKCLKELGLTAIRPYHKVSEKKTKVEKTPKPKKDATKKTKKEPEVTSNKSKTRVKSTKNIKKT